MIPIRDQKGFTLIETIVLIVLAGILLPAIIVPFVAAIKGSGQPEVATKAIYLAQQKLEEFLKYAYNQPALSPVSLTPYTSADSSEYQWQWSIQLVDSNFNPLAVDRGYKKILIRVRDPENRTYELQAVVTNFP